MGGGAKRSVLKFYIEEERGINRVSAGCKEGERFKTWMQQRFREIEEEKGRHQEIVQFVGCKMS